VVGTGTSVVTCSPGAGAAPSVTHQARSAFMAVATASEVRSSTASTVSQAWIVAVSDVRSSVKLRRPSSVESTNDVTARLSAG